MYGSINKECVVRGTLALVLRLSRFAGVAPLNIERTGNGYRVSISHNLTIYSRIFITFINISVLSALCLDFQKRAIRTKTLSNLAFLLPDLITSLSSSSFAVYCGVSRMKKMIKHLNLLEEAKRNMKYRVINSMHKRAILVIIYLIGAFILLFIFGVDLFINNFSQEMFLTILYGIYLWEYVPMIFWEIQIILLVLEVHSVLVAMSTKMDHMISMEMHEFHLAISPMRHNVQAFSQAYSTVCEVVSEMNKANGTILIIFMNCIITIIMSSYYGLSLHYVLSPIYLFMQQAWCVTYIALVLAILESCHSVKIQEFQIKVRLSKLMCKYTQVGDRIPIEMELMYKNLHISKSTYAPMDAFTLNRSFITTIASAIITYILFMVQLKL